MKTVFDAEIYTDGACLGNPGPGGYAAIVRKNGKEQIVSGGYRMTTNNRMELAAAIAGISSLGESVGMKIRLYTDSKLLVDAFNQNWIWAWAKNNWKKKAGEKVFNADLWKRLLVFAEKHIIDFVWIKGHDGIPENEQCDRIARNEASKPDLAPDIQYEEENSLWENPIPYDIEKHNISTMPTESKIIDNFIVHLSTDDSSQKFTFIAKNRESYFYGNFDKKDTEGIINILEKLKEKM